MAETWVSRPRAIYLCGPADACLILSPVFHTPSFHVQIIEDPVGVSLCGALKNVVATAAGFCDGLGWGNNAKGPSSPFQNQFRARADTGCWASTAAVMRIGLIEMKSFAQEFFQGVKVTWTCLVVSMQAYQMGDRRTRPSWRNPPASPISSRLVCRSLHRFSSARPADLAYGGWTGFGGRNRRCAEAFIKTGKPFDQLEKEMLNGQKLQGVATAVELHGFLQARGRVEAYPLFNAVVRPGIITVYKHKA